MSLSTCLLAFGRHVEVSNWIWKPCQAQKVTWRWGSAVKGQHTFLTPPNSKTTSKLMLQTQYTNPRQFYKHTQTQHEKSHNRPERPHSPINELCNRKTYITIAWANQPLSHHSVTCNWEKNKTKQKNNSSIKWNRKVIFVTLITKLLMLISTCPFAFGRRVEEHPFHGVRLQRLTFAWSGC